jgi:outer membrane protein insertion porin family
MLGLALVFFFVRPAMAQRQDAFASAAHNASLDGNPELRTAIPLPPAQTLSPVVQRIEFQGNRRIRSETLRARIFTREGDNFNEEALRRDFQALWNTQFFEDVKLEVQDSPDRANAKIVIFHVSERPIIRRIRYDNIHSVSESDILDRFKEAKVGLTVESQFDPTRIKKAQVVLQHLLGEHGRQFAKVTPTYERIPASNAVILIFKVVEGPKVKVGKITFVGNHAFSNRRLVRAMRHSRPYGIPLRIASISVGSKTYDQRKLAEDLEVGIRGLYQDNGYFKVLVKDPVTETVDVDRHGLPLPLPKVGRKHGKATNIKIEIEEGERYRMGRLVIRSSDPDQGLHLKVDALKSIFPLKPGDIFGTDKVRKALEDYRKVYGDYGYIDFTSEPLTDVDEAAKIVNLTLIFSEEKSYTVRRIEFNGNLTTRDKVIRREILLDEGNTFNQRLWELSILRLNQLGYFDTIKPEHAELKRNVKDATVDINLKVKEKGKQSIGLNGGLSGLAGTFIGLNYQTNNFLGLGETLTFSAEFGDRQRQFLFSFTEPYLFDRPIATGFSLFDSKFNYNQSRETSILLGQQINLDPNIAQNYNQDSKGFTVFASYPLRRFSFTRVGLTYGLTKSNITAFSPAATALFTLVQFRNIAGPSALNGIVSSRLTPTITYNTVNHPINPTGGKSFFYSLSLEGGPLGGNVNAVTNVFEAKYFHPINKKRNVLGFRVQTAFATGFGGRDLIPTSRFYSGGEDTIRGFDVRTVTPIAFIPEQSFRTFTFLDPRQLDSFGNPTARTINVPALIFQPTFPGGDLMGVGNIEYRIPIVGPVGMALFADVGATGIVRRNGLQLDPTGLQNLRTQFPAAQINGQLGLMPGSNFKLRTSTGIEFIVQLPIVNAPFRIFYAINPNRLDQQIVSPPSLFNRNDPAFNGIPQNVLVNQVMPQLDIFRNTPPRLNFRDPFRSFRFTVSRTF